MFLNKVYRTFNMYLLVFDVGQRRCDYHTVSKDVRTHLYDRQNALPVQSASESYRVRSRKPRCGGQWRFLAHGVAANTPVQCPVCIITLIRPVGKSSSVNTFIGQFLARCLYLLAQSMPAVQKLLTVTSIYIKHTARKLYGCGNDGGFVCQYLLWTPLFFLGGQNVFLFIFQVIYVAF